MLAGLIGCAIGWGLAELVRYIFKVKGRISWWKAALVASAVLICTIFIMPPPTGAIPASIVYLMLVKKEEFWDPFFAPLRASVFVLRWVVKAPFKILSGLKDWTLKLKSRKIKISDSNLDLYERVSNEIAEGDLNRGLMLKAEIESEGDSTKARVLYAKWRVQELQESSNGE